MVSKIFKAILATTLSLMTLAGQAISLEDFGYNALKIQGQNPQRRPLLVILAEFEGKPSLAFDKNYWDDLVFNFLTPPSLTGYFAENSNARFHFTRAGSGIIGPLKFSKEAGDLILETRLGAIKQAAALSGYDFGQFDQNGDRIITTEELTILIIENGQERPGAARNTQPACVLTLPRPIIPFNICSAVAQLGHRGSFASMAHEVSHLFGTIDIYGSNSLSQNLTLMGGTITPIDDDRQIYHLDPWHKMALGWIEPKTHEIGQSGQETIFAPQTIKTDQPVILYDPTRGTREYFILEFRSSTYFPSPSYDANVAGTGLIIWYVNLGENLRPSYIRSLNNPEANDPALFSLGAPELIRGGNWPWISGMTTPELRWLDGQSTGTRIIVGQVSADQRSVVVNFSNKTNLLIDPGFERQKSRTLNSPWQAEGGATFGVDLGELSRTGNSNGWIINTTRGWNALTQRVPIVPIQDLQAYELSAWIQTADNVRFVSIGIRNGETGEVLASAQSETLLNYGELKVRVHPGNAKSLQIFVGGFYGRDMYSWVRVDDVKLRPVFNIPFPGLNNHL